MTLASGSFSPLETAGPLLVWIIVVTFGVIECALVRGLFDPGGSLLIP
ncbi:MAG: DedA family protein, partial [Rhodococcus sp. (in: high G+C Gram-positive bacteria)]|nr:DedA family protein [Rhodococcus sp. (in: high G+C Gram-positive bacteria)]